MLHSLKELAINIGILWAALLCVGIVIIVGIGLYKRNHRWLDVLIAAIILYLLLFTPYAIYKGVHNVDYERPFTDDNSSGFGRYN